MDLPTSTTEIMGSSSSGGTSDGTGPVASCGDGALNEGEDCDDGNAVNGDGCNVDCTPSGTLLWEYRSGDANQDVFDAVAVTPDSRIFAAGAKTPGSQDRWLVQFAPDGAVVWSKTYDKSPFEALHAAAADASGVYVAGMVRVEDPRNLWVGRIDFEGEIVWEDEFISAFGPAYATGLSLTPEGDVVVAGISTLEGGAGEIWTRRYGPEGSVQWTEGVPFNDKPFYAVGPAVSAGGTQIVVGFEANPGPQALLLAYAPSGGAPVLNLTPTIGLQTIGGVAQDVSGDILVGAYGQKNGQMLVARLDDSAGVLWSSEDCVADFVEDVTTDSRGDVIAIGHGPWGVGRNIRLCKFSPEGDFRWGLDIDGGQGDDLGVAVATLPDDRVVAAGRMLGDALMFDAWLAVYSP